MRVLSILLMIGFISCSIKRGEFFANNGNISIYQLDTNLLSGFHIIKFKQNGKKGIIVSKIENLECSNIIMVGKSYQIPITKVISTENFTEATFRLNVNDIYIDGKLVFPKNEFVYISSSLKGLCINM